MVAKGEAILPADLPIEVAGSSAPGIAASAVREPSALAVSMDFESLARGIFQLARKDGKLKVIPAVERELVIQALIETNGNQVQAAKLLGITRATLRKRVEKFNITRELAIK